MKVVLLTFDVEGVHPREDFFNKTSLNPLCLMLDLLEEERFQGIFFLTASAAKAISEYPEVVKRLSSHTIGYHSSSHSSIPLIVDYTDIHDYQAAVDISVQRESSRIDPETGRIVGSGGIRTLREVFPQNKIECFRAPFLSWSPPHLEALKKLGIKSDFSSDILKRPVSFRGITFYPPPIPVDPIVATLIHRESRHTFPRLLESVVLRRQVSVMMFHPSYLAVENLSKTRISLTVFMLRFLFRRLRLLQKQKLIRVTSSLNQNWPPLNLQSLDIKRIYSASVRGPMKLFGSNPRFLLSHFLQFFNQKEQKSSTDACTE